jgi:hypothetical protein
MNNDVILSSLAMDLKRAAIGLNRGSYKMANRFFEEVLKRKQELEEGNLKNYIKTILLRVEKLGGEDKDKKAEDFLMYSTIIQNYVVSSA